MRHSLTAKALEELLMLLSAMLPADAKAAHQQKKIFLGKDDKKLYILPCNCDK